MLGLDAVSWPQVMISRPIVSATVGGALLGDAASGFLVGAVLELLGLGHRPYGAVAYPETGPAGLVAGAGLAASGGASLAPLVVAAATGWLIGWIGSVSVRVQRRINESLLASRRLAMPPRRLEHRHRLAILLDAARAGAITAAFVVPVMWITGLAGRAPAGPGPVAAAALLLAAMAVSGGVGARVMRPHRGAAFLLLAGAALAVGLLASTG